MTMLLFFQIPVLLIPSLFFCLNFIYTTTCVYSCLNPAQPFLTLVLTMDLIQCCLATKLGDWSWLNQLKFTYSKRFKKNPRLIENTRFSNKKIQKNDLITINSNAFFVNLVLKLNISFQKCLFLLLNTFLSTPLSNFFSQPSLTKKTIFLNQNQTSRYSTPNLATKKKRWFLFLSLVILFCFLLVFPADAAGNSFTAPPSAFSSIVLGMSQTVYLIRRRKVKKPHQILAKKSAGNIKHSVDWAIQHGMIPKTKLLSELERQSYMAKAMQRIKTLLGNQRILDLNSPGDPIILDVKKANKILENARKAQNRSSAQQTQDIFKAFYDHNKELVQSTYAQEINEKKKKGIRTNWKSYLSEMQKNPNKCPNLITHISFMRGQNIPAPPVVSVSPVEYFSPEDSLPAKQLDRASPAEDPSTSMPLVNPSSLIENLFENHALDGETEKKLEFFIHNVSQDLPPLKTLSNQQNLSRFELVSDFPEFPILSKEYTTACQYVKHYSSTICDTAKTQELVNKTEIVQATSKISSYPYENYLEQEGFNRVNPSKRLDRINTRVSILVVTNQFWTQPLRNHTKILVLVVPFLVILPFSYLIMNIFSIKGKESSTFKTTFKDSFIDHLKRFDISYNPSRKKKFNPIGVEEHFFNKQVLINLVWLFIRLYHPNIIKTDSQIIQKLIREVVVTTLQTGSFYKMLQLTKNKLNIKTLKSLHPTLPNTKSQLNAFITSSRAGFGAMSSYAKISNQLQLKTKQFALFAKKTKLKTTVIRHASLKMAQNLDLSIPMYGRILVSSLNSSTGNNPTATASECSGLVIHGSQSNYTVEMVILKNKIHAIRNNNNQFFNLVDIAYPDKPTEEQSMADFFFSNSFKPLIILDIKTMPKDTVDATVTVFMATTQKLKQERNTHIKSYLQNHLCSISKEIVTNKTKLQQLLAIKGIANFIKNKKDLKSIILNFFKTQNVTEIIGLLEKNQIENHRLSTLWQTLRSIPWCVHIHEVERLHMFVNQTRQTMDLPARGLADLAEFTLLTNKLYNGNNGFDNYNHFVKSPLFDLNNNNLFIGVNTIRNWVYNEVLLEIHQRLSTRNQYNDATEVWVHTGATIVAHFFVKWVDEVCKPRRQELISQLQLPNTATSEEFISLIEAGLFGLSIIKISIENNAENITVFKNGLNFKFDPNQNKRIITEDSLKTFVTQIQVSQGEIASLVVVSLFLMLLLTKFPGYFASLFATYLNASKMSYEDFLEEAILYQKQLKYPKKTDTFCETKPNEYFIKKIFFHLYLDSGKSLTSFHQICFNLFDLQYSHLDFQLQEIKSTDPLLYKKYAPTLQQFTQQLESYYPLFKKLENDIKSECHNAHTSANLFTIEQESEMEEIFNFYLLSYINTTHSRILSTETNLREKLKKSNPTLSPSIRNKQARHESIQQLINQANQARINAKCLPIAGGWLRTYINTIPNTAFSTPGQKIKKEMQQTRINELQNASTHFGSYLIHSVNAYYQPSHEALKHLDTMSTVYLKENFRVMIKTSQQEIKEQALTPLLLLEILINNQDHIWIILERLTRIKAITITANYKFKE
jgi:hypothetical protein